MPGWLRTSGLALGLAVLVSFAYSPLLSAGFLAPDYRALLEASGASPASDWVARAPLVRLSLGLSNAMFGIGEAAAGWIRLENLVLLVSTAIGLAIAMRRLLLPWIGRDHALAAAWSSALILVVHPLATPAVGDVRARADLLGLFFCVLSLAFFLRGRQDRRIQYTVVSLVLCLLGGVTVDVALGLPLLLAGAELLSAHRYRPLRVRLRTAATTFVVFGAAALIDLWLGFSRFGQASLPPSLQALASSSDGLAQASTLAVEKLGLFVLPSNPFVTEFFGLALAGAVFLLAMHPGLAAARSAPRLWGWILFGWFAALAGTEVFHADVRVNHADLGAVRILLPSVAVMSVGLGVGATALSGARRLVFPCLIALGYAALAHANALPWKAAAEHVHELRTDIADARERYGTDTRLFVVGPPEKVRGLDPIGPAVAWLAHPGLVAAEARDDDLAFGDEEPRASTRGVPPPDIHSLSVAAFLALVHEPEFEALRAEPLLLLFPRLAVDPNPPAGSTSRQSLLVPPALPSGRPLAWRGAVRSPDLDVEALAMGSLTLAVRRDAAAGDDERASWRSRERSIPDGSRSGVWVDRAGARVGVYDLGASLAWRLSDRVKRIWFEGGLRSVTDAQLAPDLPPLGGSASALEPKRRGGDWIFPRPDGDLIVAAGDRGHFVVGLLSLGDYRHVELACIHTGSSAQPRLLIEGAADWVARTIKRTGAPVAWTLDYRIDGRTLARARGRRVATPLTDG